MTFLVRLDLIKDVTPSDKMALGIARDQEDPICGFLSNLACTLDLISLTLKY